MLRPWGRHSRPFFILGLATLLVAPTRGDVPAKDRVGNSPEVQQTVAEALQREIYGNEAERRELLLAALAKSPEMSLARWHLGYIKDPKRGWLDHAEYEQPRPLAAKLDEYERLRAGTDDTAEAQLRLAEWCRRNELLEQARAHWTRVLDHNPDQALARSRLGFVRRGSDWISQEEIEREDARDAARLAAIVEWRPLMEDIRRSLEHRGQARREAGRIRLLAITDPQAIHAIEAVFADASDEVQRVALEAIAGISDPEAARALARIAVQSPVAAVRQAAAEHLSGMPREDYVPDLLASLYSPITSRFLATRTPNGRIAYRHAFLREGQDAVEVQLFDTEYRRIRMVGGSGKHTARRALLDVQRTGLGLETVAAQQGLRDKQLNERIMEVLQTATREQLPADPKAWWNWWNDVNEVFVSASKPLQVVRSARQVELVDQVPGGGGQSSGEGSQSGGSQGGGGSGRLDCLAAGTLVWTAKGPREIEQIAVGDLVLAQHPETGELAFKPVLRTTVRPAGQLIRIATLQETFHASGGHLFWVAGEGWVKARDLAPGQVLHGASGPTHISEVGAGPEAVTYNLIVADFSTYFVGYARLLSHDNSVRQPTRAIVPGLR